LQRYLEKGHYIDVQGLKNETADIY